MDQSPFVRKPFCEKRTELQKGDSAGSAIVDETRFKKLLKRMEESEIARRSELIGCSVSEIEVLESRYSIRLPSAYRFYLQAMGHRSGRLFTFDHLAATYPYVLAMTGDCRQAWADAENEAGTGPPPEFDLPSDALLIAGRLGEQFLFIRCIEQDDCPVLYFNNWEWEVKESPPSVLAWLECWCDESEQAIRGGYFRNHPNGTTP